MKVLVTGGSGYVGQATIRALRAHGHEVVALVRSDDAGRRVQRLGAVPTLGGLTDVAVLRTAAEDADAAIHLAQDYGPDTAAVDLAAATAIQDGLGSRPYVHTGGVWVYGHTNQIVDETAPQSPPPVTAWRADNEKRVLARAAQGGHPVLVMPGVVYGHGGGLIAAFLGKPARTGSAHYIGSGQNRWAMVHVDDIAELYVAALAAPAGSVYAGVDDTQSPTMRQVAEAVSIAAGRPGTASSITMEQAQQEFGPLADAFALDQRMTAARARRELNWAPADRDILTELTTRIEPTVSR
ncbi:NAD-dependent epimerase/dehydratase family protein [Mycobacterium sp.]|jgi:nucleoside-diphosphate-sugar epimerase|uniref:NAD-dependent epimerase/dehydratase family protein n=1 Tax=Mycobacterium sp. TaxID=1785 RepID=UPI002D42AD58|nr:NAD-dependent epimerase/dehydratase family protein [Mycobacterium sp.]HZA12129.1 NAD-dependent epimerase/dehydratase family protein [Mycobacterium sp.]